MSISPEKLARILAAAVQAPSGDNAQPWRFQVKENTIFLVNVPEKDTSPFNYKQTSNYIALGAALENMRIAAGNEGFVVKTELFPENSNELIVAKITCVEGNSNRNDLANYIHARSSNRRTYNSEKIKIQDLVALQELEKELPFQGRVLFLNEKKDIDIIASIVSAGEKISLETKTIHAFLFKHVTWSKKDDNRRHGFYIKTFEFKPAQEIVFHFFRSWSILSFFKNFGITDLIAKDMENVYRESGAFFVITIYNRSKENFLKTGMLLEKIWLTATKFGLSIHPTTAIPLLHLGNEEGGSPLTEAHKALVEKKYRTLSEQYKLKDEEEIAFAFRIGVAEPPSGRTTRNQPIVEFL